MNSRKTVRNRWAGERPESVLSHQRLTGPREYEPARSEMDQSGHLQHHAHDVHPPRVAFVDDFVEFADVFQLTVRPPHLLHHLGYERPPEIARVGCWSALALHQRFQEDPCVVDKERIAESLGPHVSGNPERTVVFPVTLQEAPGLIRRESRQLGLRRVVVPVRPVSQPGIRLTLALQAARADLLLELRNEGRQVG